MRYPIVSDHPPVQSHYEKCRRSGTSHSLAEMLAFRQPPASRTDVEFFRGRKTLRDEYDGTDEDFKELIDSSGRHGYKPGTNDVYLPTIARFHGDPEAFIQPTGGRSQYRRQVEKLGVSCQDLGTRHRQPETDPMESAPKLSAGIIREEAARLAVAEPDLVRRTDAIELRDEIIHRHGPSRATTNRSRTK